jgi:multisubunit Na+/H+ antiporter MnhG subunit
VNAGRQFEMSASLGIVLVLLASAIVMFAINKPRLDAVALIMLVALPFTGVLTMNEAVRLQRPEHRPDRCPFRYR